MVKLGKYLGIISLLRDARGVYILADYVPKKGKRRKVKRRQKRRVRKVTSWRARTRARIWEGEYSC